LSKVILTPPRPGSGSITEAARRLRFTQSAVSRQIVTLEAELGVKVFDRLPRGVALTDAGRALLPHADGILDRLRTAATRSAARRSGCGSGPFRRPGPRSSLARWPASVRRTRTWACPWSKA